MCVCVFPGGPHDELKKQFPKKFAAKVNALREKTGVKKPKVIKEVLQTLLEIYPTCFSSARIIKSWRTSALDEARTAQDAAEYALRTAAHNPSIQLTYGEANVKPKFSETPPSPASSRRKESGKEECSRGR